MDEPKNIQHQIDDLLAHLHEHAPSGDDALQSSPLADVAGTHDDDHQHQQHYPKTIIDVYVIERTAAEQDDEELQPPTVDSTLDDSSRHEEESQQDNEDKPETLTTTIPPSSHYSQRTIPRGRALLLFALCALLVVALGIELVMTGGALYLLNLFTPSATITIVTSSQQITMTSRVHVVTSGTADPAKQQIAGRLFPAVTMSQAKTIPTTGTVHQDARAAHGRITFYNAATYPQTVPTGELLTGADGVQLVTDASVSIPAAAFPTFGQASVAAHTTSTGPGANIRAGDVYGPCCRLNLSAVNDAFEGGQGARTYQTVTQQDIQGVVTSLTPSLDRSVQAAFQAQVQIGETLVTPLVCTQKVTPDHAVGAEATQVTVIVDKTCTAIVYDTQALTTLATHIATDGATKQFGTGYTTTGVQTTITQATPNGYGTCDLQVKAVSLWAYPFTQEQQQAIKAMIAGTHKDKATATLLHLTGIQSVSISLKNSTTIPTDVQHIHLLFLETMYP